MCSRERHIELQNELEVKMILNPLFSPLTIYRKRKNMFSYLAVKLQIKITADLHEQTRPRYEGWGYSGNTMPKANLTNNEVELPVDPIFGHDTTRPQTLSVAEFCNAG